jgi:DNA-binding response OmpR family regulator
MSYMRWITDAPADRLAQEYAHMPQATKIKAGERPLAQTLRVLVVEDNTDVADTLEALIQAWGHDTRVARDAVAGLKTADEYQPHVVLLDIGLPKMHGYDVAKRLRERPWATNLTMIAVTGWGQEADRLQSQGAGISHHLVKPLVPEELERILSTVAQAD